MLTNKNKADNEIDQVINLDEINMDEFSERVELNIMWKTYSRVIKPRDGVIMFSTPSIKKWNDYMKVQRTFGWM